MTTDSHVSLNMKPKHKWLHALADFIGRHEFLCLSAFCIALTFFRFLYCGFTYSYTLDDYIQYHNYALYEDYWYLILRVGLFKARPLAGLSDLFVFSPLFDHMILGVLLCAIFYGFSAAIFYRICRKAFGTGPFFLLFYLIIPINIEGTYWVSAASRITFGLFFTALALYLLIRFLDNGRAWTAAAACVTQLISISFYEQIFVLSCALWLLTVLLRLSAGKHSRRMILVLAVLFNAAIYFIFTGLFPASGAYTARTELCLPISGYYFNTFLPSLLKQLYQAIAKGGMLTLIRGFRRGFALVLGEVNIPFLVITFLASAAAFFTAWKRPLEHPENTPAKYRGFLPVICMVCIMLAPLAPFFIIANPYFSLRSVTPCLLGAALIADLILRKLAGSHRRCLASVCTLFVFICYIAAASEVNDYRRSYETDQTVLNAVMDAAEDGRIVGKTGIFELNATMIGEQNMYYHEHIAGITSSIWAMKGALTCVSHNRSDELGISVVPLATDEAVYYLAWNRADKILSQFDRLLYWDSETQELYPLTAVSKGDENYLLYTESGTLYAHVFEENGIGYIRFGTEA